MTAKIDGNVIQLFGYIWFGDSDYIVNQIQPVFDRFDSVNVKLHTPGGSVFDGNMIYNTLANAAKAGTEVVMDIIGLAASMGSVIMLSGTRIRMAENAFAMTHSASGATYGTANDHTNTAKLLTSIDKNITKKYAKRTGKSEKETAEWLVGDNWFSAEEALEAGLIDEIIDSEMDDLEFEVGAQYKIAAAMHHFMQFDPRPGSPQGSAQPTPRANNSKPDKEMKLSAKNLTVLGLESNASDEQVNNAVQALVGRAETAEAKVSAAEDRVTALENKMNQEQESRIKAMLDTAIAEGRLTAANRAQYETLAKADFAATETAINAIPKKKSLAKAAVEENNGGLGDGIPQNRSDWSFNKWRKEDPKGLLDLKANNLDAYNALVAK